MHTMTILQPSYGPQGQPYSVKARFADRIEESHHWTEREAMDARDAAFDTGAHAVYVAGLPCRVACGGFPVADRSLLIED